MHDDDVLQFRRKDDRREILHGIEAHALAVERRIDAMRRDGDHADRVAVRRRARGGFSADVAARANAVFDDDLLSPLPADVVRDHARENIERAAGGGESDEPDGLVGESRACLLRDRRASSATKNNERRERAPECRSHGFPSTILDA